MALRLKIPKIYSTSQCCHALFEMWQSVNQQPQACLDLTIDFQKCSFLSHLGVAFLGGLVHYVRSQGGKLTFDLTTLKPKIYANLAQNGFLSSLDLGPEPWSGNSVPYRQDERQDIEAIMTYLLNHWLRKDWVDMSLGLREAIAGQVWELYANAFEHGQSPIGVFSCGQHYPAKKELHLTVIDFGQGIPNTVSRLPQNASFNSAQALEWAFQAGTSTAINGVSRGMGLNLLKTFIASNRGNLKIFSNAGRANIKDNEIKYKNESLNFRGTLINIAFKCSETYYCLASEGQSAREWF
jgi:hypothetical protein